MFITHEKIKKKNDNDGQKEPKNFLMSHRRKPKVLPKWAEDTANEYAKYLHDVQTGHATPVGFSESGPKKVPQLPFDMRPLTLPSLIGLPQRRGGDRQYVPAFDKKTNDCYWEYYDPRHVDKEELEEIKEDAFSSFHMENIRRAVRAQKWRSKTF